jgi:hypothetical protein
LKGKPVSIILPDISTIDLSQNSFKLVPEEVLKFQNVKKLIVNGIIHSFVAIFIYLFSSIFFLITIYYFFSFNYFYWFICFIYLFIYLFIIYLFIAHALECRICSFPKVLHRMPNLREIQMNGNIIERIPLEIVC